jgi:hypothetical protein
MGVIVPNFASSSEDRASGAQIIDGGLRFDSSKSQYLARTVTSTGNRRTFTYSCWIKLTYTGSDFKHFGMSADTSGGSNPRYTMWYTPYKTFGATQNPTGNSNDFTGAPGLYRDYSGWHHIVMAYDLTQGANANQLKIYINGVLQSNAGQTGAGSSPTYVSNQDTPYNTSGNAMNIGRYSAGADSHWDGYMSQIYWIDGQQLDASYFGYTDPLTNTWRPKKFDVTKTPGGSYGTNGFYLPFDGSAPIGQDQSGRGNNWTPVNFGGSNTIEKATGALPILNTDGGGKVARVGVRTDANASSLVLALPLVGIKSDFSNAINSGTSNKTVTTTNAVASSTKSNLYGGSWYFDGNGDYLTFSSSSDFAFGTGDFTVEMWIYSNSTSGTWWDCGQNANSNNGCAIFSSGGYIYIRLKPGTDLVITSGFTTGRWQHLAVTRSSGTLYCFLDGVMQSTTQSNSSNVTTTGGGTGTLTGFPGPEGVGYDTSGYIQDLRVYKGLAKYTSNFIPASTDPDVVPDSPSGVSYSSNVALVPSTDGAVAFDGSGDRLTLNSSDFVFGTSSFTVEAFIYKTNTDAEIFFSQFLNTSGGRDGVALGYQSGAFWILQGDGSTWNLETTVGSFPTNKWVHLAVSRDYSQTKTYYFIDGQLVYTYTSNINLTASNNGDTVIGNAGTTGETYAWTGFISNLHIVKGTALYTSNFTPPSAPISSVANTKLLCCKSQTSATVFDVSPGTITANGDAKASNFNPFTANINTQRGKQSGYATLDPLAGDNTASPTSATFTNGNLTVSYDRTSSGSPWCPATIAIPSSGKWYWEFVPTASSPTPPATIYGIVSTADSKKGISSTNKRGIYLYDGTKVSNTTYSSYGSGASVGDTIGIVVNMDAGVIGFYKNGIYLGDAFSDLISSGYTWTPLIGMSGQNSGTTDANFGQKPFKFPPPSGFQPLTLANTPRPTIVRPDQYVGVTTYTGNGAARSINVGFKPDFVWIKERGASGGHVLYDTVRGATKHLATHSTNGENTDTDALTSFNNDGFSLGSGYTVVSVNGSTRTYVGWAWKAGGNSNTYNINDVGYATASAAGITEGTQSLTGASINTKSGFSIVRFTQPSSSGAFSFGHGLGKTPNFVIMKSLTTSSWYVYHSSLGSSSGKPNFIVLNSTGAAAGDSTDNNWGTGPTSTIMNVGDGLRTGGSASTIAYLWAEIPGFSKFGSYTGNGSSDGPVIITGFRPKWILLRYSGGVADWWIYDTARGTYNVVNIGLRPNLSNAEYSSGYINIDILSNGFKIRDTGTDINTSSGTHIYAAFAESPTFNLYGAQSNAR